MTPAHNRRTCHAVVVDDDTAGGDLRQTNAHGFKSTNSIDCHVPTDHVTTDYQLL